MNTGGVVSIGKVFRNMLTICPGEVGSYGKCLASHASTVDKGICENEFRALMSCFKKVSKLCPQQST